MAERALLPRVKEAVGDRYAAFLEEADLKVRQTGAPLEDFLATAPLTEARGIVSSARQFAAELLQKKE